MPNSPESPQTAQHLLENLIGGKLEDAVEDTAPLKTFLNTLPADSLERHLVPQWVVLAAGKGTRIDPSGRLSKTLDIMFGAHNTLQLSRRYLPGNRPHIVVINPQMAEREDTHLFEPDAILCVQSEMNGTGGALQAALPEIQKSDAECIGISFGDEPFLEQAIFVQTLLSHFLSGADVTLCGKVPETVVDKGGLFFDADGKLVCTKEWYDMSETEKTEMWHRLARGEAFTNTGITLIRKSVLLERIHRLQPHKNRNDELHHVDMVRLCYEDGLKTNAYIYRGEVLSGVNRWTNVLTGEAKLFEQNREMLAQKGVRADPGAQITLESEDVNIGTGCYLLGRVHIGKNVRIGNYCRLENVTLLGATNVGDAVGLEDVSAQDTTFVANPLPETLERSFVARRLRLHRENAHMPVSAPIRGLATGSSIKNCTFDAVTVGSGVNLSAIQAYATVIPADINLAARTLGVPLRQSPPGVPAAIFNEIIPSEARLPNSPNPINSPVGRGPVPRHAPLRNRHWDYLPGVFTLGEKRNLPDWEALRQHVQSHSETELIPRATQHQQLQQVTGEAVKTLLDMQRDDGSYLIEALTPEELWGSIFEMVTLHTGNPNPYHADKLKARQTAIKTMESNAIYPSMGFLWSSWLVRLKVVVAGNIIDYSSARVVAKLEANPNYFSEVMKAAGETPFAIDCSAQFREMVIADSPASFNSGAFWQFRGEVADGSPKQILWLADNDGEAVFDIAFIQDLVELGHRVCVVGKADNASNDATVADLRDIANYTQFLSSISDYRGENSYPQFRNLQMAIRDGVVTFISSGSKTIGTNLYQATPEFANAVMEADLVISKGQGNFFTTFGWKKDTFYLFLSKGVTAEQSTGVVADKTLPVDGLILAYVPGGTRRDATLRDIC